LRFGPFVDPGGRPASPADAQRASTLCLCVSVAHLFFVCFVPVSFVHFVVP